MGFQYFIDTLFTIIAISFAIGSWRNGKNTKNSEEIKTANDTIDILQKSITTLRTELDNAKADNKIEQDKAAAENLKNHDDIIRLQKDLEHAQKENARLTAVLDLRNPEMTEFMKLLTNTAGQANEYMKSTSANLKAINEFMIKIDTRLQIEK